MLVTRRRFTGLLIASALVSACAPAASPAPTAAPAKPAEAPKPASDAKPTAAAPAAPAAAPAATKPAEPAAAAKPADAKPAQAAPASKAGLYKITMASGAVSATDIPYIVAEERGLWDKYGISVDEVSLTGGSQVSQALAGASVQVASGGLGALMDARLSGIQEITILGSPYPWQFFQIYAQPQYKTMEDLRGKTIAASDPGSSSDRALIQVGQKFGMVPNKDFQVTYVGGTKERVQVLEQKVVDASIISPPNGFIAGKQGFTKVLDLIEQKIPFGYAGLASNTKWSKENPQHLENFFKAYIEGLSIAKAEPEFAKAALGRGVGIKETDVLEEAYNVSAKVMPLIPELKPELITLMLELSSQPAAKTTKPEQLYDPSLFKKIVDSGFLKTLPVQS